MYQASDGAAFTDDLRTRRAAVAGEMPGALSALGATVAPAGRAHLAHTSKLLDAVVTTPDARVTHANRAATALLHRPTSALAGRELASFVSADRRPVFRIALARSRDSRLVEEWPIRFAPAGAPSVDCRVRTTGTRPRTGTLVALSWIITDALGGVFD